MMILGGESLDYLKLGFVFGTVTLAVILAGRGIMAARERQSRVERTRARPNDAKAKEAERKAEADRKIASTLDEAHPVGAYYAALHNWQHDDVRRRLLRAGRFTEESVKRFQQTRYALAAALGAFGFVFLPLFAGDPTVVQRLAIAIPAGGLGYIAPTFILDRLLILQQRQFNRIFPDFIDMLVVCVEAGMTIDSAVNRIAQQVVGQSRVFSLHLQIVMLETRAGKPMRHALTAFADRTEIQEARSLVAFVRQSEELGVSISKALRVYAAEMRQRRGLAAEEKANALPTKMLLPIGLFLFPVTLAIVLVPAFITFLEFFGNNV